jgi:hypothetical protein
MTTDRNPLPAKAGVFCGRCGRPQEEADLYRHRAQVLCEECCLDARQEHKRKTHWQYIGSIKGDYLRLASIPPKRQPPKR